MVIDEANSIDDSSSDNSGVFEEDRTRQQIVDEIVETETNYVADLKIIVSLFIDPIRSKIKPEEYIEVFGNIEKILDLHKELLVNVMPIPSKQAQQQNMGESLYRSFNHKDFVPLYIAFCKEQENNTIAFEKLRSSSKTFAACVDAAKESPLSRRLTFPMMIIKPVQRITKYPLLLRNLIEHTPKDYQDFEFLQMSLAKISGVLDEVNNQKRILDDRITKIKKLKELATNLDYGDKKLPESTTREFVREGTLSLGLEEETLRCLLFNDVFILTKNKKKNARVVKILVLSKVLVRNYIEVVYGSSLGFELISLEKEETLPLYFGSDIERNDWFEALYRHSNAVIDNVTRGKYYWFTNKCVSYGDKSWANDTLKGYSGTPPLRPNTPTTSILGTSSPGRLLSSPVNHVGSSIRPISPVSITAGSKSPPTNIIRTTSSPTFGNELKPIPRKMPATISSIKITDDNSSIHGGSGGPNPPRRPVGQNQSQPPLSKPLGATTEPRANTPPVPPRTEQGPPRGMPSRPTNGSTQLQQTRTNANIFIITNLKACTNETNACNTTVETVTYKTRTDEAYGFNTTNEASSATETSTIIPTFTC
ncbi:hypothetical protein SAMD00019534_119800 [Acytostelium subglobosum LB1]|uniref:hypothetical protein n=1 Tax=Acytostelium subglobosum LB1 TaxID=1410327 RepID=UPI000645002D|nr:hypothetical protein SAMD00019534_119800 [Acytostelium subglobosum LB1]GAM28804.1 hypothetical protein SAMD00019534_119800 [Acytostelium subglobosum LB1]|eukprot:XP_012748176.1 hypothetical protein SAMD00019534_119800 [Acytostelium subglobosum LB1]